MIAASSLGSSSLLPRSIPQVGQLTASICTRRPTNLARALLLNSCAPMKACPC